MISVDYVRTMMAYGTWMNGRMLDDCARIADADRTRDLGAYFKSLHGTLDHLLWGDLIWMGRFDGVAVPAGTVSDLICPHWDDLVALRRSTDERMQAWADGVVTTEWLAAPFSYVSKLANRRRTLPAWVMVTHMLNHGTHHRGQATTLMMQLGIDPGVTDMLVQPRLYDGSLGIAGLDGPA